MAFCTNCGAQVADGVKFCPSCGTPVGGTAAPQPAAVRSAKEKVGNIKVCPACGAAVESFQTHCSSCGHEFNNVQIASGVKLFFEELDEMEATYVLNDRKKSFIEGYIIPNAKEEILEFIIMAASRIDHEAESQYTVRSGFGSLFYPGINAKKDINAAWKAKIQQAYMKGRIAFAVDKEAMALLQPILDETKNADKKAVFSRYKNIILPIGIMLFLFLFAGLLLAFTPSPEKEAKKLNNLVVEITQDIQNGDLNKAQLKAVKLNWEFEPSKKDHQDEVQMWNERRQELLQEIKDLQAKEKK
jgi:uncharacterized membrane protein YvbJ